MMLRPFARVLRNQQRTLHTTLPAYIKIKPSSAAPPSPAERPPLPPKEPPSTQPTQPEDTVYEPEVRNVGTGTATPSSNASAKPKPGAGDAPLTPPSAAQASKPTPVESQVEEPTEPFDLSKLPSLDIDQDAAMAAAAEAAKPKPEIAGPSGEAGSGSGDKRERTNAKAKSYQSSVDRRTRSMLKWGLTSAVVLGLGGIWYVDGKNENPTDPNANAYTRFKTNLSEMMDYFNKPAFDKLLPDPLPAPHQRPYTLVIDLEGLLVSSTWDRAKGWQTVKRPGVDYFLAYLSQFYEIVLFTSQPLYTAAPVAEKLDPYGAYLPYKLFRDSTRYVDGKTVKDLTYLNRDPSKVVVLDVNEEHVALQPENAIVVKPWAGTAGDKGLVDLIPFLESIGIFAPQDVRPILKAYAGKDIPIEYAKKEAEAKAKAVEEWERKHPHGNSVGGGWLSSAVSGLAGAQPRPNQPMTYLESKRAQAQKMYQEEQKYWKDNAEEFAKLIEEDKQRQLSEMKGSVLGFLSGASGAAPPAEKKWESWQPL